METISFCGSALSQLAWLNNGIDMSAGKYIITDGEEKILQKDKITVFLKFSWDSLKSVNLTGQFQIFLILMYIAVRSS